METVCDGHPNGSQWMVGKLHWWPTVTRREREVVGDSFQEGEKMRW
jgi:hypothetical protein